ncbi:MAG: ASKHA domain-containing protein [Thermoplasmata archaeon]
MPAPVLRFQPLGNKIEPRRGRTLLDLAREAGVAIESICDSAGRCGKCKVILRSGSTNISALSSSEKRLLSDREVDNGFRLACQARVTKRAGIVVEVPEQSRRGHHRLLVAGVEPRVKLEPAMRKILLTLPPATMRDLRADDDRLLETLSRRARVKAHISAGVHRDIPHALRKGGWRTTVTLFRETEIIRADPGDTTGSLYGVAVDIGTTKVVAYLVDLNTGETIATESMPNPQIPYGEDLMSRISFSMRERDGRRLLQKVIVDGLNELMAKLCSSARIDREEIFETLVVGNTAMHHFFFGIPAEHVAAAPYAPAVRTSLSVSPSMVGLDMYPFGRVTSLPNIAGFVGADAVADLIASGLYKDTRIGMMIDIGTNTEIIAGNKDRLLSCSCASGPAFEGAHIKAGMRASTGAIERVWIDAESKEVRVRTVDDAPPRGICGSGIVDAISEMLKAGIVDASGKLVISSKNPGTRKGPDGVPEFVLAPARETATGEDIVVTQRDIQEIQLAKAAIFTGVSILMRKLKLKCSQISRVYAAGAFGTYVDPASAISIGMYPDVPVERIRFIGNAAGSGARMCLKSTRMRDLADRLSKEVEYIELAAEKDFQSEFAMAMFLPHRDIGRFPRTSGGAPRSRQGSAGAL